MVCGFVRKEGENFFLLLFLVGKFLQQHSDIRQNVGGETDSHAGLPPIVRGCGAAGSPGGRGPRDEGNVGNDVGGGKEGTSDERRSEIGEKERRRIIIGRVVGEVVVEEGIVGDLGEV